MGGQEHFFVIGIEWNSSGIGNDNVHRMPWAFGGMDLSLVGEVGVVLGWVAWFGLGVLGGLFDTWNFVTFNVTM